MVFEKVMVMRGMVYRVKTLKKHMTEDDNEYEDKEDRDNMIATTIRDNTIPRLLAEGKCKAKHTVMNWSCCSKIRDKYIFVGVHLFSINRESSRMQRDGPKCKNCDAHSLCDRCISIMENGEMIDVVEVDNTIFKTEDLTTKHDKSLKKVRKTLRKLDIKPVYFGTMYMLDDCLSCS